MTDDLKPRQGQSWWIISLAISVVCCSLFFIFFATYLFSTKESQMLQSVRLSAIEQRVDLLMGEMENLRRRGQVQQIQIIPAPAASNGSEGAIPASSLGVITTQSGMPPQAQPTQPGTQPPSAGVPSAQTPQPSGMDGSGDAGMKQHNGK